MANLMNSAHYNLATMGQVGSAVIKDTTAASIPPSGKVFIAITMLTDCTFDSGVADPFEEGGLVSENGAVWASTRPSTAGSATNGQTITSSITFPKGVTIYGRYTEIDVASGTCIAYVG